MAASSPQGLDGSVKLSVPKVPVPRVQGLPPRGAPSGAAGAGNTTNRDLNVTYRSEAGALLTPRVNLEAFKYGDAATMTPRDYLGMSHASVDLLNDTYTSQCHKINDDERQLFGTLKLNANQSMVRRLSSTPTPRPADPQLNKEIEQLTEDLQKRDEELVRACEMGQKLLEELELTRSDLFNVHQSEQEHAAAFEALKTENLKMVEEKEQAARDMANLTEQHKAAMREINALKVEKAKVDEEVRYLSSQLKDEKDYDEELEARFRNNEWMLGAVKASNKQVAELGRQVLDEEAGRLKLLEEQRDEFIHLALGGANGAMAVNNHLTVETEHLLEENLNLNSEILEKDATIASMKNEAPTEREGKSFLNPEDEAAPLIVNESMLTLPEFKDTTRDLDLTYAGGRTVLLEEEREEYVKILLNGMTSSAMLNAIMRDEKSTGNCRCVIS